MIAFSRCDTLSVAPANRIPCEDVQFYNLRPRVRLAPAPQPDPRKDEAEEAFEARWWPGDCAWDGESAS